MQDEDKIITRRANNLAIAWCVNSLAYSIVYPFIPLYLHNNRGFSMNTVSWIFPFMGIGVIIGPLIAGPLVDCLGRRVLLIGGPILRALIFFLLAFLAYSNSSFIYFCLALMLSTCVGTFFTNASDAYLVDMAPPDKRSKVYSRIRVGTNIGWAIGPMLGAFLARTPFSLLFALTGFLCLSAAFFTAFTCPEIKSHITEKSPSDSSLNNECSFGKMLKHHQFIFTIFFYFILTMLMAQLYSTLSVYSTKVVGISKNMLGFVYSINGFTIVFLQIPLTKYLDKFRWNLYPKMIIGAILYGIGYFSLGFAGSSVYLMVSIMVITLGEIIIQPAVYTLVSTMAHPKWIGRYMGMLGMMRGIGYAVGPWIGARLFAQMTDKTVALWSVLASFSLLAIIGFVIIDYIQKRKTI